MNVHHPDTMDIKTNQRQPNQASKRHVRFQEDDSLCTFRFLAIVTEDDTINAWYQSQDYERITHEVKKLIRRYQKKSIRFQAKMKAVWRVRFRQK